MKEVFLFILVIGFIWVSLSIWENHKKELHIFSVRQKWKALSEDSYGETITLHVFATNICREISEYTFEVPEAAFRSFDKEDQKIIACDICKSHNSWVTPVKFYLGVKGSLSRRCDVKTLVYM